MKILNNLEKLVNKIQGKKEKIVPLKQEENIKLIEDEILSLTFSINSKSQLFIDGKWANNSIQMASLFAEFIFMLFNGSLYQNIFNYLATIATLNDKYFEFAQNTSLFLQEKIEKDLELTEQPIIRPSQAFNFNNKNNPNTQNPHITPLNDDDDDLEIPCEDE